MAVISGIGCSSRIGGYFYAYGAHTTHGRALPYAQGVKLANQDLEVIAFSGDGDAFAIGMGHTIHAFKRNVNMTYVVMDNHVYGLTKGQASPRSDIGFVTKTTPHGAFESPLSICETAIAAGATFVAQSYMINREELVDLIQQAMDHDGFSFINVFSPCVTYNKRNSYDWFKEHLVELPEGRYYIFDIIGLEVQDTKGNVLGTVTDVLQPGANDVYVVSKDGEPDQLFAAIEEVVKDIDVENKLMIVDPPEWI